MKASDDLPPKAAIFALYSALEWRTCIQRTLLATALLLFILVILESCALALTLLAKL